VPLGDFLKKVPNAELEPFIELLNFGSANYKFNFCNTLAQFLDILIAVSACENCCAYFAGNLGRVDFINDYEYDLFVRPDTCNPRYRYSVGTKIIKE
jgi:hypothetical protein